MKLIITYRSFYLSFLLFVGSLSFCQTTIFPDSTSWKYLNDGSNQATAWYNAGFSDASWPAGNAWFAYGEPGATTTLLNNVITTYFRKSFTINGLNNFSSFNLNLVRDDGAIIYVNGVEVARSNMPGGAVTSSTLASNLVSNAEETQIFTFNINRCFFVEGLNVIAVEVHQWAIPPASTDIRFQLNLSAQPLIAGTPSLSRGPYLQMGNQTAITIRWRTDIPCLGRADIGFSAGSYTMATFDETCLTTEHEIRVTGLTADTKYYYRVGTTIGTILQWGPENYFTTFPTSTTIRKLKFIAFGDCGTGMPEQLNVKNAYLNFMNGQVPDAWLLLGDNVYQTGTDVEFSGKFFGVYGNDLLKNHKLYPAIGNHDYGNTQASASFRNLPYFKSFTMPTSAECGGVASGTEAYYSYDIGDVHFVVLDSYGKENENTTRLYDVGGAQVAWLRTDLATNTKKWTIVYFHHPPFTKGTHNSDVTDGGDLELRYIRENVTHILEEYGVDMILCGHSHNYERSYFNKGFFQDATAYNTSFQVGAVNGSGKYDGTSNSCPYFSMTGKSAHGTVYVVAGSSGWLPAGTSSGWPHNAMYYSDATNVGTFYFEIEGNRLDAKYITYSGSAPGYSISDQFTIMKDVNNVETNYIVSGSSITLTASWPGNYNWNTTATTRSITVIPPEGTTNYSVTDNFNCITNQYIVHANICTLAINTWVGNVSSAWENGLNWSCGIVPGPTSEVVIKLGTPYQATVNSNVTIKKLSLQSGANVRVNTGFTLDIIGQ